MFASDKLRALAARIRREPTPIADIIPLLDEAATEAESLRARVAELEADAERLNWLQANPRLSTIVLPGQPDQDCYMYAVAGAPGLKLREIIDAARGVTSAPTVQK